MKGMGQFLTKKYILYTAFIIHKQFAVHNFANDDGQKPIITIRMNRMHMHVNCNGRAYFCVSIFLFCTMINYEKCEYGLFSALPLHCIQIHSFDLFYEMLFGVTKLCSKSGGNYIINERINFSWMR